MHVSRLLKAGAAGLALAFSVPAALTAIEPAAALAATAKMSRSDLRVALNKLLAEHVTLAAAATGAALAGQQTQFEAAAGALDKNSEDLAGAVGLVYGDGARDAFLPLWRKHIGFFVDYTTAVAKNDAAGKQKAVDDLVAYASDFGAFLQSANKRLPKDAVAGLVKPHIMTLAAVVDAQAAKDWPAAYKAEREASAHMQHIADALADAIAKQFPKRFK